MSTNQVLEEQHAPSGRARQLLACFMSGVVPGIGHLMLGQPRKGAILLTLFCVLLAGFWPFRLLRFYWGFAALYTSWFVIYLYAAGSACLSLSRSSAHRLSKWWLVAALPLTVVSLSLLGALATRYSGFRSFSIPSTSMEDTIRRGDQIVVDTQRYRTQPVPRQEIIVFLKDGTYFLKRVVGTGGDSVVGKDGRISVNGEELNEPYVEHRGQPETWMQNFGPIRVLPGEYFVLGDNRDVSFDSRSADFGMVPAPSVLGAPLYIFGSDRPGKSIR